VEPGAVNSSPSVQPPCLFCDTRTAPFSRVEHPIPESMGNDDLVLPSGVVCDPCNPYFGSKIEAKALCSPPFSVERMAFAVRSKKEKLASYRADGFSLHSTGSTNRVVVVGYGDLTEANRLIDRGVLWVPLPPPTHANVLVRFFLKMGLELLCLAGDINPYDTAFDTARLCARFGNGAAAWDLAYGVYPRRGDLLISTRTDEIGDLETHQVYQYKIGIMAQGDVVLCFAFAQHVFACNLTRPHLDDYIVSFNSMNEFKLAGRFS
jgi:hypothetical protein